MFILERTDDLSVNYYYSSPGSGTSVAKIDLKPLTKFTKAFFCFTWSPDKITLSIVPRGIDDAKLITAEGSESKKQIRVGNDGSIYFIGDENVSVMNVSIYQRGKEVLSSTALEAWMNTKSAIEILGAGKSENEYIHECVVTNLSLSIMVTGFESYLKKRFLELEEEGIAANTDKLFDSILSSKEKKNNFQKVIIEEAMQGKISILKYIVQNRRINFQNFNDLKKAFKKTYGLTLTSAKIDSSLIVPIKKYLVYRHRIIHVSPLMGLLNQPDVPPDEPVFPKESLKREALGVFNEFITLFHNATLKLEKLD
ncbi:MAG: hypothetical protein CMC07_08740 [Flavobacteriaceae bacterium]|nr:hypothetical protein [Flavobacteriaceae bacterium]